MKLEIEITHVKRKGDPRFIEYDGLSLERSEDGAQEILDEYGVSWHRMQSGYGQPAIGITADVEGDCEAWPALGIHDGEIMPYLNHLKKIGRVEWLNMK